MIRKLQKPSDFRGNMAANAIIVVREATNNSGSGGNMEQTPHDKTDNSGPVWGAWLSFGILSLAFATHYIYVFKSHSKSLIGLEGVLMISASVLTAITRSQMAEFYRRKFQRRSTRSFIGAFYVSLGGPEVLLIHRLLAVNFVIVAAIWGVVCVAIALNLI